MKTICAIITTDDMYYMVSLFRAIEIVCCLWLVHNKGKFCLRFSLPKSSFFTSIYQGASLGASKNMY